MVCELFDESYKQGLVRCDDEDRIWRHHVEPKRVEEMLQEKYLLIPKGRARQRRNQSMNRRITKKVTKSTKFQSINIRTLRVRSLP